MFNPAVPRVMHIDLNSCFASVEQQANPLYRGHPLVVAAYVTNRGCILAASREAKKLGIKTGMYVGEGRQLCPQLIVLPPDPPKYRFVNKQLVALCESYTPYVEVKSIDEMVLQFPEGDLLAIAGEIKAGIKRNIGDWLTVSIGIAPNRYLAKVASNLHKPDGLDVIWHKNVETVLGTLKLEELTGIKEGYGNRLRGYGITTALAFYNAPESLLRRAFASKIGRDWWLMLHGWESPLWDRDEIKTVGHSYALPKAYETQDPRLHQILCQLVEKMGRRLRQYGFLAQGIHIACQFKEFGWWHHGEKHTGTYMTNRDLYREALRILLMAPNRPVKLLAVTCFSLTTKEQLTFLNEPNKKLAEALDAISDRWGEFTVFPARMLAMEQRVLDRIAFGGVR